MLTKLTINGYRGIQNLELNDFGRVNVFVGKNGVGKTSVLEAIALVASGSPEEHKRFGYYRGITDPQEILRTLFFQGSIDWPITLTFELEHHKGSLGVTESEITHAPRDPADVGDGNNISVTHRYDIEDNNWTIESSGN
ncbi:MAG: AAA family ATPase [Cyanothece sp. SIO2G6]|nr:AAA family ATPase [Cyanothece sp. SIO2G6]